MQDDKKQDLKSNLPKRKTFKKQNSKKARQKKSKIAKMQDNKKAKGCNAMQ